VICCSEPLWVRRYTLNRAFWPCDSNPWHRFLCTRLACTWRGTKGLDRGYLGMSTAFLTRRSEREYASGAECRRWRRSRAASVTMGASKHLCSMQKSGRSLDHHGLWCSSLHRSPFDTGSRRDTIRQDLPMPSAFPLGGS
jgi:hypothetical protein